MNRILFLGIIILLKSYMTFSQTYYVSEANQKGYIKDGKKYSFWEYYDSKGNLELKFNHSTGRLIYIEPDTSKYMIEIDGNWTYIKPDIYSKYIGSELEFRKAIAMQVNYPEYLRENNICGYMFFSFIVDSTSQTTNFKIENDICAGCGIDNLNVLISNIGSWIPAFIDGKSYNSKFVFPLRYVIQGVDNSWVLPSTTNTLYDGKLIDEVVIVSYGINVNKIRPQVYNGFNAMHSNLENALANKEIVEKLNLSNQKLSSFQTEIIQLRNLKELYLRNNKIKSLSSEIRYLKKLEVLAIDNNILDSLPTEIELLDSLKV